LDDLGDLCSALVHGAGHAPAGPLPADGSEGCVHSFEIATGQDGPGGRFVLFVTGCALRCLYCHNPDSWHLKDGVRVSAERVLKELGKYALTLRLLGGGLTISGGEPLVQPAFTRRLFQGAKERFGLHTCLDTSGFLGARADDEYLRWVDLVLLDIKSSEPELYRRLTGVELAPTLVFARRLAALGKPVWARFVLVPGLTDAPANIDGVARFCAGLGNVGKVDVLPFHQMGRHKWHEAGHAYALEDTPPPDAAAIAQAKARFRACGLAAP
jgi:pyruvate formate lyase activating enzyme